MAPRKPDPDHEAKLVENPSAVKKSGDKVIKRPARGYHRFRKGPLNVTPKGKDEKELVKLNQTSPLLRLPPEIRNSIWEYALGGKIFRFTDSPNKPSKFNVAMTEPKYGMAVLRTCRQIYSEAASLPSSLNTFSFSGFYRMKMPLNKLTAYHRKHFTYVRLEIWSPSVRGWWYSFEAPQIMSVIDALPGLKEFRVCLFLSEFFSKAMMKEDKEFMLKTFTTLAEIFQKTCIALVMEEKYVDWSSYNASFYGRNFTSL